jgi:molybdate transport system regulatory protein
MKLSARNQMEGVICEIQKGVTKSVVKIEVRTPAVICASITNDAPDDLRLRVGDGVFTVIKASDLIVGKLDMPQVAW